MCDGTRTGASGDVEENISARPTEGRRRVKTGTVTYAEVMSGLSNSVLRLFSLCEKKDLIKYCRSESVISRDLFEVIVGCETGGLPWQHKIRYRNFVPEHLLPSPEEREKMGR